jgi:riboflavin-specific deaminase-like protein
MEVRPLVPEGAVSVTSLYLDLLGVQAPEARPHLALNMVVSADGRATLHGTADIGSRLDRALLKHLRSLADAVMVGAGTFRANDFTPRVTDRESLGRRELSGKAEQPLAVVVSRRGSLSADARFFKLSQERVVAVSEAAPAATVQELERAGATVLVMGESDVDLQNVARWLRQQRDVHFLLCEGGPHLNGRLFAGRLVDEVFLTQSWRVTGEPDALRWIEADGELAGIRLEPAESYEAETERFQRFRVQYA